MEEWLAEVDEFLAALFRREENDHYQSGRKRCRYCRTKERDEDDGSWLHDSDCPYEGAKHLLLSKPLTGG